MRRIYFDNNATTPLDPRVFKAMYTHKLEPLNPSSIHFFGQMAKQALNQARRKIASYLEVKPPEILFTSGGTEGINQLLMGLFLPSLNGELITTEIEHSCIFETAHFLKELGVKVKFLKVDKKGCIQEGQLEGALTKNTRAICLSAVNAETGVKNDLETLGEIALRENIPLIIDGVALMGKESFNLHPGISAMCFSAHKFHGPKGVGFNFIRSNLPLIPFIRGGAQEFQRRAGTENLEGILGLAKAIELLSEELPEKTHFMEDLRSRFESKLMSEIKDVKINGESKRICNVSNLSFGNVDGESLLMLLDQHGIAASHGSACSSGALEPSRVLRKMGLGAKDARSSLRFSFSRMNTREEIDEAINVIVKLVKAI